MRFSQRFKDFSFRPSWRLLFLSTAALKKLKCSSENQRVLGAVRFSRASRSLAVGGEKRSPCGRAEENYSRGESRSSVNKLILPGQGCLVIFLPFLLHHTHTRTTRYRQFRNLTMEKLKILSKVVKVKIFTEEAEKFQSFPSSREPRGNIIKNKVLPIVFKSKEARLEYLEDGSHPWRCSHRVFKLLKCCTITATEERKIDFRSCS